MIGLFCYNMAFTDKDLEMILEIALDKAPQFGVEPADFESLYRASVAEVVERKANDVNELYTSLKVDAFYIESFQMRTKREGSHPEAGKSGWDQVWSKVNAKFGTKLADSYRGEGRGDNKVYVWLEKDSSGNGVLHSYGNAHADGVGRNNMHYFAVVGDFDQLGNVVESFTSDPTNMSKFTEAVFDWKNEVPRHMGGEPNLYSRMKELYVNTPESGKEIITVK